MIRQTFLRNLAALTLLAATAPLCLAREPGDGDDTSEHPEIKRFPGFFLDNSQQFDYQEFEFALSAERSETKAGRFWFVDYCLRDGARQPSTIELIRNYENAFRRLGGALVYRNDYGAVYRMSGPGGGERWVHMNVDHGGSRYQLTIVEVAAMQQKLEFNASEMAQALKTQGNVALYGLQFDTGRATLQPGAEPLLAEVLALLKGDPKLRLSIEGHTDNVGDAKANLTLSQQRAQTVVAYLVQRGVAAARLRAVGQGSQVPVADNRTEAGRAKNRRVELVRL
ncbi:MULTISPECIES: OmpA family protein [Inhella]|uniref:OmpA family protein n=1 Tax=Inhella proteolytica TaxID=2795029 RepID=A0A931J506_9BURK|nr:OmpA family protein [Inhella proteolytica]MBH9579729.1 OmpA family protein [Inhella proteolytica]